MTNETELSSAGQVAAYLSGRPALNVEDREFLLRCWEVQANPVDQRGYANTRSIEVMVCPYTLTQGAMRQIADIVCGEYSRHYEALRGTVVGHLMDGVEVKLRMSGDGTVAGLTGAVICYISASGAKWYKS